MLHCVPFPGLQAWRWKRLLGPLYRKGLKSCKSKIAGPFGAAPWGTSMILGQAKWGGVPIFFGKGPDCVADPVLTVPRMLIRREWGKGQTGKIPGQSPDKPEKFPEKSGKSQKGQKGQKSKDKSRSGNAPVWNPPRWASLKPEWFFAICRFQGSEEQSPFSSCGSNADSPSLWQGTTKTIWAALISVSLPMPS